MKKPRCKYTDFLKTINKVTANLCYKTYKKG